MHSDERPPDDVPRGEPSREALPPVDPPADRNRIDMIRDGAILFEPDGFRLVDPNGRRRAGLHAYESLTHVYGADRMLLIGTVEGLLTIRNSLFRDPEADPERVRRMLLERIGRRPHGARRLDELAEVDRLGARRTFSAVTWATIALCILGTAVQLRDPFFIEQVGSFVPDLFVRGEYWRAVTSHFIHGLSPTPAPLVLLFGNLPVLPMHLAINVGGLLVLGRLVERPLGAWRTAIVVAASGVGTIVGILFADHLEVIGASGLVSGFAGAILAMELAHPDALPSFWRLPRRFFIGAILLQFAVIDQVLSAHVAGGAHLGGFAGGFVSAWLLGRPSMDGLVPSPGLRAATLAAVALVTLGIVGAVPLTRHDMGALERHAVRLLNSPPAPNLYRHDNAAAWFIATEGGASDFGLDLAVALADRAVAETERADPGILDTLAEALFQSGNRLGALLTIDEAIRLVPHESYFLEQRRRFTGERAAEDRPPQPGLDLFRDFPFDNFDDDAPAPIDPEAPQLTI